LYKIQGSDFFQNFMIYFPKEKSMKYVPSPWTRFTTVWFIGS
jgi:hypothetical protein